MPTPPTADRGSVLLISAPWPLYNRPSIQLGTLKAYLGQHHPDVRTIARHFFLHLAQAIGYETYQGISDRTWLAESVYAALLYPERADTIADFFGRQARANPTLKALDFNQLVRQVKIVSDDFIQKSVRPDVRLAGFSISFCQLSASLYLIRKIKALDPRLPIVIGGSTFSGPLAGRLFGAFPQIDFAVSGEGEEPLNCLVGLLKSESNPAKLPPVPGIFSRWQVDLPHPTGSWQMKNLSRLPCPDYDDYFERLNSVAADKRFFPILPVEASRGCWWQSRKKTGLQKGCAFCNLNLQWQDYRWKPFRQVAVEIDRLTTRHQTLSVAFCDNVLPPATGRPLFELLARLQKDFRLFGEVRATISLKVLKAMQAAGVKELQIGIEALSASLLRRLNKGTGVIDNLKVMRDCEALGIANVSNLILQFPGSDAREVEETLRTLEFVRPFRPLRCVRFWLGVGSCVWQQPADYGLKAVFNHPHYGRLFPAEIVSALQFMIQGYRADQGRQQKLWRPVRRAVASWQRQYEQLQKAAKGEPALHYRDGREFLIIVEHRPDSKPVKHRLTGTSRRIYLYCQKPRRLQRIKAVFAPLTEADIRSFLTSLVEKRLMFEEDGRYLSLAIPLRATYRPSRNGSFHPILMNS